MLQHTSVGNVPGCNSNERAAMMRGSDGGGRGGRWSTRQQEPSHSGLGDAHCPESGTTPESVYGGGKCGFSDVWGARLCSVMPCESRNDVLL
jgi:hypothetical protein